MALRLSTQFHRVVATGALRAQRGSPRVPAASLLLPNQAVQQQQQQQQRRSVIPELLLRPLRIMPAVPLLSAQREHTSSQCMNNGNDGGDDEHGEDAQEEAARTRPADSNQHDQLQLSKKARTEADDSEKQAAAAAAVEGEGAEAAAALRALERIKGFRFDLRSIDNTMDLDGQREAMHSAHDRVCDVQTRVEKSADLNLSSSHYQWSMEFDQLWNWKLRCLTCDKTCNAREDSNPSRHPFYGNLLAHFKTSGSG